MNLAEALVQAFPELPAQTLTKRKFKFNPNLVVRDEVNENGEPRKVIFVPEKVAMYYLDHTQWALYQLFDGERSFAEVAQAYADQFGVAMSEQDVREFAFSSADSGLFYESAQDKNITLSQKLKEERQRRIKKKGKFSDLSHIIFQGWDPDRFLAWVHEYLSFIYTPWFTALTVCLFGFMTYLWIVNWGQIGHDTWLYYTFTEKSGRDLLEFWLLFLFMAFFHESAHGLTSKHYGASVHNMGFQLIYLAPAFAVEITELWARVGRRERLWAILAGVWIEMVFCAIATVIWWGTPSGTGVHEWAYKLMMITGIVVLIVNLNPLMKLDGYYALAEIVGISELKENSTAFVSGWTKKHLFGLPVDYDFVPTKRRLIYVPYALLSGIYSYLLLFAVSRFTFNIFHRFAGDWAVLPAGFVAWKIFNSRIRRFIAFTKTVYHHNRDKIMAAATPQRKIAFALIAIALFTIPFFHKTAEALFVLEPVQRAVVRAQAPGFVEKVYVSENETVNAGGAIATLRNAQIEGESARSGAELSVAQAGHARAQVSYVSLGAAESEVRRAQLVNTTIKNYEAQLSPSSPITGTVVTPRVRDLEGRYVAAGTLLAEIEDSHVLRARLYLPEYEIRDVTVGTPVSLRLRSSWRSIEGRIDSVAIAPSELPPGLVEKNNYVGLKPPPFYVAEVRLTNPGSLRSGMSGEGKIVIRRQSLLGKMWTAGRDFVGRRMW